MATATAVGRGVGVGGEVGITEAESARRARLLEAEFEKVGWDPELVEKIRNCPTVEYSPEEFDRHLRKWYGTTLEEFESDVEITRAQIASGELVPQTVEEFAAEMGYTPEEIAGIKRRSSKLLEKMRRGEDLDD